MWYLSFFISRSTWFIASPGCINISNIASTFLETTWWRHQMETFSELLAICAGNSPVNSPPKGQWRWAVMFSLIPLTLSQWLFSVNPVTIQCASNLVLSVHWNATGEIIIGSQCVSSVLPVVFQWPSSVFQLCKLALDRHWDTTGC